MDRSAAFDKLKVPAAKRAYILDTLEPVLEPMVAEVLNKMPIDPVTFMLDYLLKLKETRARASSNATGSSDDELPEPVPVSRASVTKTRGAVSAEAYGEWNQKKAFEPKVYPKSEEQRKRLEAILRSCFMFQALDAKDMAIVVDAMSEVRIKPKNRIIKQGDSGDFLFVIEEGVLDCFKQNGADEKLVRTCQTGDVFGELALLYNVPRAASVESRTDCVLWRLDRETFAAIVSGAAIRRREMHEAFLKKVPILASLDSYELNQVADALKTESVPKGKPVVKQGEKGDKFFIVEEGRCHAEKSVNGLSSKVMEYSAGDYFGELALLNDEPRAASVIADSDCTLLSLDRKAFDRLLGRLQSIMESRKYK